jgi:predicted nucleic acid-binding Zn ribbon protein
MSDKLITETEARLNSHEQVCAERYASIANHLNSGNARMTKIEYLLYGVMVLVLLGPGEAATFIKHLIGA